MRDVLRLRCLSPLRGRLQLTSPATPHIRAPIRHPGAAPKADITIVVEQGSGTFTTRILCKPTASFTSEWERMRFLRLRTRKCRKYEPHALARA